MHWYDKDNNKEYSRQEFEAIENSFLKAEENLYNQIKNKLSELPGTLGEKIKWEYVISKNMNYDDNYILIKFTPISDITSEEAIILKIKFEALSQSAFEYDWNNRCEYSSDINSVVYLQDIPPNAIVGTCKDDDSDQDLEDFKNTEMYDIILDTFWNECETNLEREEEEW